MEKIIAGLKKFFSQLLNSCKKNKKELQITLLVLLVALLIGCAALGGYYIFEGRRGAQDVSSLENADAQSQNDNQQKEDTKRRLIDGVFVSAGEDNYFPVAIMIDNYLEARPPSNLSKANLIIEAPTEAGISRMIAIFAGSDEIKEIGPIRSARPYYLDWAKEFGALYMHVGGSPEALHKIKKYNIFDLNEYYNEWYYWRDPNRTRPHNVYTSTELFGKALADLDAAEYGNFKSWDYKDEAELEERGEDEQEVTFNFSNGFGNDYEVTWEYDRIVNNYLRYQDGSLHKERNGTKLYAKNIVIQFCEVEILDEIGRRKIDTIGTGEAIIFVDGQIIKGSWQKEEMSKRTLYFDEDEKEIEFNAGTTWVEVLPVDSEVIFE